VVLRVVAKLLIPLIVLFAFYVQFHGDLGAGGGFPGRRDHGGGDHPARAGVRAACDDGGHSRERRAVSLAALGVVVYAGVGVVCMINGGGFLDYDYLFPRRASRR
jgi:multicomponent Na+:H+ antiporter subunit B